MTPNLTRRGLIGAIICAPAVVRASNLMPIKVFRPDVYSAGLQMLIDVPPQSILDLLEQRMKASEAAMVEHMRISYWEPLLEGGTATQQFREFYG